MLTLEVPRADKTCMASVQALGDVRDPAQRGRERGQAMVEFAIIAPVFILLVVGIIQFGIGLNWWLDMQRIANQGARWAVVDAYPGCPRTFTPAGQCDQQPAPNDKNLQEYLANEEISGGLNPCVDIQFPEGKFVGKPVQVTLRDVEFDLVPLFGFGLSLEADATMRMEWVPTQYSDGAYDETGTAC
jgi:hypothetical protein